MKVVLVCLVALFLLGGCKTHFITDTEYRRIVERDFENKKQLLENAPQNLFAVFDTPMTLEEREALQFLYAYSPLIDLTINNGEFLLGNVRHAFKVRSEMPWGKEIPEDIFRHFVLPLRGSNESLDSARFVFYDELRDRVIQCKDMEQAALEVNHWCHEKAIYKPTNARTCAPLTMTTTAYGRCGEESVFALAAMRSVGIPARQVYTPRWAHCDDNHAWIEVWVDGEWKYLGACEPEPRLNIAWFTAPVRRGLFMQARVFGKYISDEEVVSMNPNLTNVNVTGNYTETAKVKIQVVDEAQQPVAGAKVEYKIYNYGEYYPAVVLKTDKDGYSELTVGLGDWLIWASKDGRYGFDKLDALQRKSEILQIVLNRKNNETYRFDYDIIPPAEKQYEALVSDEERAVNDRRFMYEDSVRNAYVATFPDDSAACRIARDFGVNEKEFAAYIKASRGNYPELISYLQSAHNEGMNPEQTALMMKLLGALTDKDLQDMKADSMFNYIAPVVRNTPDLLAVRYSDPAIEAVRNVLCPRVENEPINFGRGEVEAFLRAHGINWGGEVSTDESVRLLLEAMKRIQVVDSVNTINISTPPAGVVRAMVTDSRSKDLFFVAACRIMGIAARLNPVNAKPEYYNDSEWLPVVFTAEAIAPKGRLMIRYDGTAVKDPLYFVNFTVAKIENGVARTIDLGSNDQVDMGAGASYRAIFSKPVEIEVGDYILVTGNRRSDGSVLSNITAFTVKADSLSEVKMEVRDAAEKLNILGQINTGLKFLAGDTGEPCALEFPNKGYTAIALIEANKEPVNHLIRDMSVMKEDFEDLGIPLMFIFTDKQQYEKFSRHDFRPLPSVMLLGYDKDAEIAGMLAERLQLKNASNFPLIVIADKDGNAVFISQGYRIGLGTQIMKYMTMK